MYRVSVAIFMSLNIYELPSDEIVDYSSTPKLSIGKLVNQESYEGL